MRVLLGASMMMMVGVVKGPGTAPAHGQGSSASPSTDPGVESLSWLWIRSQLGTGTVVASPSSLIPDADYDTSWTGRVAGRFVLRGVPVPAVDPATPVVVDFPASADHDYRGIVTGHLDLPRVSNRWVVNLVRPTPEGVEQGGLQSMAGADGSFSLDLSRAALAPSEHWGLQVLDAAHGYRPERATWPHPGTFSDLVVRAAVVTDRTYVLGDTPAGADGTFEFASSRPGTKIFQLVDVASGAVLAEAAPDSHLVRSYDVRPDDPAAGRTHSYDQALALITADSIGDASTAGTLATGLMRLQTSGGANDGAFVTSAAALNPEVALTEYRSGNHSIATYALLRHARSLRDDDPDRIAVVNAARRGVLWLLARQVRHGVMSGLVTGGQGQTLADGSFDPTVVMRWASTEHNVDAWHALHLAAVVLPDPHVAQASAVAAEGVAGAILSRLWDPTRRRFLQGWQPEGPDPTPMLDINSWGAIVLDKLNRPDLAALALAETRSFAATEPPVAGYAPSLLTRPLVWFEGSAGVSLAQHRLGSPDAVGSLDALRPGRLPTGAYPEASRDDAESGMSTAPAVAATAWVMLADQAHHGRSTIWDEAPSTHRSTTP